MAINGWNFLVQVYYIPSFYQLAYNYSAVRSAALLLPITLMQSELLKIAPTLFSADVEQLPQAQSLVWSFTGLAVTVNPSSSAGLVGRLVSDCTPAWTSTQDWASKSDMLSSLAWVAATLYNQP
jgi:hypothetical protein